MSDGFTGSYFITMLASPVAQSVKCLPAVQETWVRSLGREDPLEKEMATHSSTLLPGQSHGWRSLVGYSPWVRKESDTTARLLSLHTHTSGIRLSLSITVIHELEKLDSQTSLHTEPESV